MMVSKAIPVLHTNNPQNEFKMLAAEWFSFSAMVCLYENSVETAKLKTDKNIIGEKIFLLLGTLNNLEYP